MKTVSLRVLLVSGVILLTSGCSTWDSMTSRQKGAVGGAAIGGTAAAVITGGGLLSTIGGAAIGGVIGDQVGKR